MNLCVLRDSKSSAREQSPLMSIKEKVGPFNMHNLQKMKVATTRIIVVMYFSFRAYSKVTIFN